MSLPAVVAIALTTAIAYAIGSISFGYIVAKRAKNIDLRRVGSGSTGATNTFRALGFGAGVLVSVLDILKGIAAVWIASVILERSGEYQSVGVALAAIAVVVGHCWPAVLRGEGGRGVATGFGALLFVATPAWASAVAAFAVALALTRMVSVGSLASVVGALAGYLLFSATGWVSFHWATLAFILIGGAIVYIRHLPNIQRIARGAEPRLRA